MLLVLELLGNLIPPFGRWLERSSLGRDSGSRSRRRTR
jgi:hypothetical protein